MCKNFLQNFIVTQPVKFSACMTREISLPCSQKLPTELYLKPNEDSPHHHTIFLCVPFLPSTSRSWYYLCHWGSLIIVVYAFSFPRSCYYLPPDHVVLLDFITFLSHPKPCVASCTTWTDKLGPLPPWYGRWPLLTGSYAKWMEFMWER